MRLAVIGVGANAADWTARLALSGHPVACAAGADSAVARTRAAWERILLAPLPAPGPVHAGAGAEGAEVAIAASPADAAATVAAAPRTAIVLVPAAALAQLGDVRPGRLFGWEAPRPLALLPGLRLTVPKGADPEAVTPLEGILREAGLAPQTAPLTSEGAALVTAAGGDEGALTALLAAMKGAGLGLGRHLRDWEARLYARARAQACDGGNGRLPLHHGRVPGDWVDYNDHMTESRFLQAFGDASDGMLARIGSDDAYRASGHSFYTVETHIRHLREARQGDRFTVATRLLGRDEKRLRLLHVMRAEDGTDLATAEQMLLHVDMHAARAAPMPDSIAEAIDARIAAHAGEPVPDWAGRAIRSL